jgi:hypothetical protein
MHAEYDFGCQREAKTWTGLLWRTEDCHRDGDSDSQSMPGECDDALKRLSRTPGSGY